MFYSPQRFHSLETFHSSRTLQGAWKARYRNKSIRNIQQKVNVAMPIRDRDQQTDGHPRPMQRLAINPTAIQAPLASYSHGLLCPAPGRMLFASGQLGVAPDGQIPEDIEAQAVLCFENIKAILAEAGMDFSHVVRFGGFVTDRAHFPVYGAVRSRYVSGNAFASTLVIVTGFTRPEFKVEVEVTAVA
jgi:2-iminobutanoate/2-iminopropanoate deaminase